LKITILLDYPDDASPQFGADMELHGGKVETVQFSDLFQEHETLEEEARALLELDPRHQLWTFRRDRLTALLNPDDSGCDDDGPEGDGFCYA